MRFEVFGFNQKLVSEKYGKNVDANDLLLLDYVIDAIASPTMKHIVKDDVAYVWLSQEKILADLPILNIGVESLRKKLKHLVELNLLNTEQSFASNNRGGSKTFYGVTETCFALRFEEATEVQIDINVELEDERDVERAVKNYRSLGERAVKNYRSMPERPVKNYTSYKLLAKTDKELTKTDKDNTPKNHRQ